MSGSVTPARRSRSEYEDEVEEEDEISVDGEEPQSSARKRTRIDEDEEGSDEDEDYGQADGDDEDAAVGLPADSRDMVVADDCHSHKSAHYCLIATDAVPRAKAPLVAADHISLGLSYASGSRTLLPTPMPSSTWDRT